MIKVNRVIIKEFRGIRSLTLDLAGKNYAICGPNGTGKSGIVDALEFALTGNISRLSGKGRGALSVKEHGPHVNSRSNPEKSVVSLDVTIPALNKTATITRSVKNPRSPTITPNDPDVHAALTHVEQHPEFVLSRREIIKYVLAEPGERSKELQALLQLDALETARANLLKIANATARELKPLDQARTLAREGLLRTLGIADVKQEALLVAANEKRQVLGLPALMKLEPTTSIRDGLETQGAATPQKVAKVQANTDHAAALASIEALSCSETQDQIAKASNALLKLKESESSLDGLNRDAMLKWALEYFDGHRCPVCEQEWDPAHFKDIVDGKRARLSEIAKEREVAEVLVAPIVAKLKAVQHSLNLCIPVGPQLPQPVDVTSFVVLRDTCKHRASVLEKFLPLSASLQALEPVAVEEAIASAVALGKGIGDLPEPNDRDAARDYLTVGQERLEQYRSAASRYATAKQKATVAQKVHEVYGRSTDAALEAIFKEVEAEFRQFYRTINGDDEGDFEAQLIPSLGKLSFEVDFYGKGFFPPGAYHSEGHQDGMGLCLYLALMKHLLGDGFTFAVLDDVLMSVDTGHRREVCQLLRSTFPNTQFVLTTHDEVWLRHMKSAKLVEPKSAIEFRKWHVDHGPSEWKDTDVWSEIDGYVDEGNIRGAASLLRYYLEHLSAEICGRLGGRVEFKGDGRYELGDLLPAAVEAIRSLLKKAKAAANSWNDQALVSEIGDQEAAFAAITSAALVDQWQINPAVHYNEWADLKREDFAPVVAAFKNLETQFECDACKEPFFIAYTGKTKDSFRCACSKMNRNLRSKGG